MAQNIYDEQDFFEGYSKLDRSVYGLEGAPEWPSIVKMLPKLGGLAVIDLGCGYGWFSRYARSQGAESVLGVDISAKMLDKAREMTEDGAVEYRREDLEIIELPKSTYDLVYSSLTLHYVENVSSLFAKIYASLKPGGHFIFSAEHPIYTAPKNPGWLVDKNGQKSWPINSYQSEGRRKTKWYVDGVIKYHRLMGTYLNSLIKEGFAVKYVEEFGPTPEQIQANPALQEEIERPMFVLVSVQKLNKI